MRRALGFAISAVAGCLLVSGGLAASASADVISYTCPSTGCVVTVANGVLTAASGSGGTYAVGGINPIGQSVLGVLGPMGTGGGASIGQTSTAGDLFYTFIGSYGAAGQGAGATLGPDNTAANVYYYRYNLFGNGENVAAAYTSSNHVNTANGQACAIDLGNGGCIGVFNTSGPAGTTLGQQVYVVAQSIYLSLEVVNGQPVSISSSIPLPVS